jgi:hypothetical protein
LKIKVFRRARSGRAGMLRRVASDDVNGVGLARNDDD